MLNYLRKFVTNNIQHGFTPLLNYLRDLARKFYGDISDIFLHKKSKPSLVTGFTLIETIVAIFVFAILIVGVAALTSGVLVGSQKQAGILEASDRARKVAFGIINELRNAQTGNNGAYPLVLAEDDEIVFFSNPDRDSSIERVRYYLQNNNLYKGVVQYNGISYPTSTEVSVLVQRDITNGTAPIFYYYEGSYAGSSTQPSLSQPIDVTDVKYVRVNLKIQNRAGVSGGNSFTITAGGSIRNLKTNLGE